MQDLNRASYEAWKESWVSGGKTLEDAVDAARKQGGDAYAERLKQFIEEMEAPVRMPV